MIKYIVYSNSFEIMRECFQNGIDENWKKR